MRVWPCVERRIRSKQGISVNYTSIPVPGRVYSISKWGAGVVLRAQDSAGGRGRRPASLAPLPKRFQELLPKKLKVVLAGLGARRLGTAS